MTNTAETITITNEAVFNLVIETYGIRTPIDQLTNAQMDMLKQMTNHTAEMLYLVATETGEYTDSNWSVDARLAKMIARRTVRTYLAGAENARYAMTKALNAATSIF